MYTFINKIPLKCTHVFIEGIQSARNQNDEVRGRNKLYIVRIKHFPVTSVKLSSLH